VFVILHAQEIFVTDSTLAPRRPSMTGSSDLNVSLGTLHIIASA
jgi:hypothetical protein